MPSNSRDVMWKMKRIIGLLTIYFIFVACSSVQGCQRMVTTNKGGSIPLKTYYIGRFSLQVPERMTLGEYTSELAYAKIKEVIWPTHLNHEVTRITEWNNFMENINKLKPPKGKNNVIIEMKDFPGVGLWAKGVFYHYADFRPYDGKWVILMDAGPVAVWFYGNSVVEKEKVNHYLERNILKSATSYTYIESENLLTLRRGGWFFLRHGGIDRPYDEQEESQARFEDQSMNLVLTVNMEMDFRHYRQTLGLIEKTKGILAAAALQTSGNISKIRLNKREVAGMKGEESILRITEDGEKTLLFTWEFNGKEDSGEYPTTTIKMESSDGKLDEKIRIWDAVLDSMKPMFERKK